MGCCKGNHVEPDDGKPKPTMEEIYKKELVSKRHNCTDIICLVLFIVLCLIQISVAIIIFIKGGDPANVLLPHDSSGNACKGDTPYLFYFNLYDCASISAALTTCSSPTVCINTCPTENLFYGITEDRSSLLKYCNQPKLSARYSGNIPSTVSFQKFPIFLLILSKNKYYAFIRFH